MKKLLLLLSLLLATTAYTEITEIEKIEVMGPAWSRISCINQYAFVVTRSGGAGYTNPVQIMNQEGIPVSCSEYNKARYLNKAQPIYLLEGRSRQAKCGLSKLVHKVDCMRAYCVYDFAFVGSAGPGAQIIDGEGKYMTCEEYKKMIKP